MVSKEQSAKNAKTATAVIARELGIYENDGGGFRANELTPADQVRLADQVAHYVIAHPSLFDANAQASAKYHLSLPGADKPLAGPGDTLSDYTAAILSQVEIAADAVGGVGRGVLNTFKLAEWVLPVAAVVAAGIVLFRFYQKSK
jgi:hypothetical protein